MDSKAPTTANADFPLAQLARLLASPQDPRVPAAAAAAAGNAAAASWSQLFVGMASGALQVGSRQAVKDVPVWVTPEVLAGGFASGKLLAALAAGDVPNASLLTEEGAQRLSKMLDTGCYRLKCAEHGALLVVVWLLRSGCVDEASALMAEIAPYFEKLRFYPDPAETPIEPNPLVSVCTVAEVREQLAALVTQSANLESPSVRHQYANAAALGGWIPLKHRLLALFVRTLECEHTPKYESTPPSQLGKCFKKGKLHLKGKSRVQVMHPDCPCHDAKLGCGWPLQQFSSPGWRADAEAALREYEGLLAALPRSSRRVWNSRTHNYEVEEYVVELNSQHTEDGTSLHTLVTCLEACVASGAGAECKCEDRACGHRRPKDLHKKFVGRLRDTLAGWNSTRGLPGSPTFELYLAPIKDAIVAAQNAVPATDFVPALDARLKGCVQERGLADPEAVLGDVELRGARRPVPDSLKERVRRAREGTLGDLIARQLITSSEMLAALVPGLTAEATSVGFEDPVLRRLDYAVRVAFRARHSLLLFNLEHQVTLGELPWAAAIRRRCARDAAGRSGARRTLELIVKEALCSFPQTILPNKLLQSCRELAAAAEIKDLPLVDEIASDIFEERFSPKFLAAARIAARALGERNLYAAYYGLTAAYRRIEGEDMTADAFGALCYELAGVAPRRWGGAAANGQVIERQQLLTTQNLAVLTGTLGLELDWAALAAKTWAWLVAALSKAPAEYVPRLRLRKDAAYAWRQLVYYVSRLPPAGQSTALTALVRVASAESAHLHCLATFLLPLVQVVGGLGPAPVALFGWTAAAADGFLPA